MSKDETDNKTVDLFGGPDASVVAVIEQATEDAHLASEHSLIAVRAYIKDESKAAKKTKNAERQKRFAEKQAEAGLKKAFIPAEVADALKQEDAGLVVAAVPVEIAEAVKAAGGDMRAWAAKLTQATPANVPQVVEVEKRVEVEKLVEVEKVVEVEKALTEPQKRRMEVGRRVEKLAGWRRSLALWLIRE